ncbi:uncharacterized protein [Anabrus simplex]|uniref:uncharacterized protein n=1 Tax=Anabrus simplex TaxID=316456 RepID=UPI0035A291C4
MEVPLRGERAGVGAVVPDGGHDFTFAEELQERQGKAKIFWVTDSTISKPPYYNNLCSPEILELFAAVQGKPSDKKSNQPEGAKAPQKLGPDSFSSLSELLEGDVIVRTEAPSGTNLSAFEQLIKGAELTEKDQQVAGMIIGNLTEEYAGCIPSLEADSAKLTITKVKARLLTEKSRRNLQKNGGKAYDTGKQQYKIFREFLMNSFPCFYMNQQIFGKYMLRLGWTPDCLEDLFRACDIAQRGALNYKDFLYFLSIIDPATKHGGAPAEIRCRYIFRYYDKNGDGKMEYVEFLSLIQSVKKLKKQPIDASSVSKEAETNVRQMGGSPGSPIPLSNFLTWAGSLKFRGMSLLLRSPRSVLELLKESPDDKPAPAPAPAPAAASEPLKMSGPGRRQDPTNYEVAVHTFTLNPLGEVCEMEQIWNLERDLHGNYPDLHYFEKVFWHNGPALSPSSMLFLGDYVDRGPHSVEVISYLIANKVQNPDKVKLLRGNHEVRTVQKMFTFYKECLVKFGDKLGTEVWERVNDVFDHLPLAAVVDGKIFCCHGGIPAPWACPGINAINAIPSPLTNPNESELAWQLMWNDPIRLQKMTKELQMELAAGQGFAHNARRGAGQVFTSDALKMFLSANGLTHVVRAHEVQKAGFQVQLKGMLITVFSSSRYGGGNNEAACVFAEQNKLRLFRLQIQ